MAYPTTLDDLDGNQQWVDGTTVVEAAPLNAVQVAIDALQEKVGIDSSADTDSLDYKVAHKGAFADGATVFNTTVSTGGTFQDLDLSAQVGANVAMVLLEITANGDSYVAVRPKGFGGSNVLAHTSSVDMGACQGFFTTNKYGYMPCFTNSSGVIQIGCSSAAITVTIKLVGFTR